MKRTIFDIDVIREYLGPKVFARGEGYAEQQRVEIVSLDDDQVLAHVDGTETYIVEMTVSENAGICTCPAFEDWGLCKHLAAVALTYNDLSASDVTEARGRISRLRDGLALDSREALVERLVNLARRDPKVLATLEG